MLETPYNLNQILPKYPIDSETRDILCHLTTISHKDLVRVFLLFNLLILSCIHDCMWGLTLYLTYFVDYLRGRKNKIFCRVCGLKLKNENDLDIHIRNNHRYDI